MITNYAEHFWSKVSIKGPDECWEWREHTSKFGYGSVRRPRSRVKAKAHRMAWELTNGLIPDGLFVLHKCDNPSCCNPAHLFLGTQKDNVDDCMRKGRRRKYFKGSNHFRAKLTEEIVKFCRKWHVKGEPGRSAKDFAQIFGVATSVMQYAINGKTWKHVQNE